jgi:hypothetical protein
MFNSFAKTAARFGPTPGINFMSKDDKSKTLFDFQSKDKKLYAKNRHHVYQKKNKSYLKAIRKSIKREINAETT